MDDTQYNALETQTHFNFETFFHLILQPGCSGRCCVGKRDVNYCPSSPLAQLTRRVNRAVSCLSGSTPAQKLCWSDGSRRIEPHTRRSRALTHNSPDSYYGSRW